MGYILVICFIIGTKHPKTHNCEDESFILVWASVHSQLAPRQEGLVGRPSGGQCFSYGGQEAESEARSLGRRCSLLGHTPGGPCSPVRPCLQGQAICRPPYITFHIYETLGATVDLKYSRASYKMRRNETKDN